MDYSVKYDDSNPISIKTYAKKLIGHTFKDVLESLTSRDFGTQIK